MSASAPLTLPEAARLLARYLDKAASPGLSGTVLAVSGGPDSVALMRLAAALRRPETVPLTVATVDHGLRAASLDEARTVAGWAGACALPHRILAWSGPKPRTGLQEAARAARYGLLAGLARELGATHVLTAHTLDDQAETVLMRLTHGTGIGGLAGMRAETRREDITLARPFLGTRKARLVATCAAEGWPTLDDPSNADPRFARTRLRRLMPLLTREGLTAERLAALAARAARAEDALQARAAAALEAARLAQTDERLELDGAVLAAEPDAIVLRVMANAVAAVARSGTRPVRLERLERHVLERLRPALAAGGARRLTLTLGGVLIALRHDRRLVLRPEPPRRGRVYRAAGPDAAALPHSLGKAEGGS